MKWEDLKLWTHGEEKAIQEWVTESLEQLIDSKKVGVNDGELTISGKLYPIMCEVKKKRKLIWTLHREASSFDNLEDAEPFGHPDFRLSTHTVDLAQYDYDIECKLVRVKRPGKKWDYCKHYVTDGIIRYHNSKYGRSLPAMGTMIGYFQEGEINALHAEINSTCIIKCSTGMLIKGIINQGGLTKMVQSIVRPTDNFTLNHLWADLR